MSGRMSPCPAVVVIVEDNPSSLADWYLTRALSLAAAAGARPILVKNMSRASTSPVSEPPRWLAAYLGADAVVSTRFGAPGWLDEIYREVTARADEGSEFAVTTAFEDYVGVAAHIAKALRCTNPIIDPAVLGNGNDAKDKFWLRSRWSSRRRGGRGRTYTVRSTPCGPLPGDGDAEAADLLSECPQGVVVKPRGMAASLAVRQARSLAELTEALALARAADFPESLKANGAAPEGALVEEYLDGREYSLEGLVQKGRASLIAITEKHTGCVGTTEFAELAHIIPARGLSAADLKRAAELLNFATATVGVMNAVVHLEAKMTSCGWRPIEMGLRPGGDRIPMLLSLHAGVDLFDLHVRAQVGAPTAVGYDRALRSRDEHSALIFGQTERAWRSIRADRYPVYSPGGDWCGRWGCAVLVRQPSAEIDRLLRLGREGARRRTSQPR